MSKDNSTINLAISACMQMLEEPDVCNAVCQEPRLRITVKHFGSV